MTQTLQDGVTATYENILQGRRKVLDIGGAPMMVCA